MTWLKGLFVGAATLLGVLPALGLAACIAVPWWLWRTLLPRSAAAWPLALGLAIVGVFVVLGIGFG